jgi:hypothetical protein
METSDFGLSDATPCVRQVAVRMRRARFARFPASTTRTHSFSKPAPVRMGRRRSGRERSSRAPGDPPNQTAVGVVGDRSEGC